MALVIMTSRRGPEKRRNVNMRVSRHVRRIDGNGKSVNQNGKRNEGAKKAQPKMMQKINLMQKKKKLL